MDTWLSTFAIGTSGTYDLRALLHDCSKQVATEGRAESAQHSTHWIENCCESSSNCHLDPLNVKFPIGSATTPSELCQSTFLRVQLQCSVSQPSCCEGQCKIPLDASPQNLEEFFEDVKSNFGHLVEGLSDLEWNKLPDLVKEHIKNNPKMTAVHAVSLIVGFTPGLVWGPAFTSLGFTSLGPMVGSLAAWSQATLGTQVPFRIMQSAAMGGRWGVSIANGAVRAGTLVGSGVVNALQTKGHVEEESHKSEHSENKAEL